MHDFRFSILDVETTGFSPSKGDRIVEIGLITVNLLGEELDRFETLINPQRDVSATHIHGISAEMVSVAPKFSDVLPVLLSKLQNSTIVGHNVDFDLRFLSNEIARVLNRDVHLEGLCTLRMSKFYEIQTSSRKLESLCQYFDIEYHDAHSAIKDCEATAELFKILTSGFIQKLGVSDFIRNYTRPVSFPSVAKTANLETLTRAAAGIIITKEKSRLGELINRLPSKSGYSVSIQQYLNVLDEVLLDRRITQFEENKLFDLLIELNISKTQAIELHDEYLRKLVRVYLLDQHLSDTELSDLNAVAEILQIGQNRINDIIDYERSVIQPRDTSDVKNLQGKSVCFTGKLHSTINGQLIERDDAEDLAKERGMIPKSGVSKKLDYLITADPHSLSGKAQLAREYGVNIVAEPVFWIMLGVSVD